MREIIPGIFHWTTFHDGIGAEVSSYYLSDPRALIDPLFSPDAFDGEDPVQWLAENGPPSAILLTNRHHYRHSGRLVEAFDIPVRASRPGMHQFSAAQHVEPFDFGDEPVPGVIAHEVGAICPDETALEITSAGALALADGLVRFESPDAPLGFVPDFLLGDEPEKVKRGLRASYERLLDRHFEHLLLAHGHPLVGDGRMELIAFLGSQVD
jgi:hypothetical protein